MAERLAFAWSCGGRRGRDRGRVVIPCYIAGPFRAPTAWGIAENVRAAERVHLAACRLGLASVCPHTNTAHFQGECSDEFWIEMTLEILRLVAGGGGVLILVPGWERSSGTRGEVAEAFRLGMPVFTASSGDDPVRLGCALRVQPWALLGASMLECTDETLDTYLEKRGGMGALWRSW